MINSIRCLEAEIISLQNRQIDPHNKGIHTSKNAPPLALHNSFESLSLDKEPDIEDNEGFTIVANKWRKNIKHKSKSHTLNKKQNNQIKKKKCHISESDGDKHTPFDNVTVIGDSHVRNLAQLIRNKINDDTSVSGVCKPGAGLMRVKPTEDPPRGHCYVVMAGTNDIGTLREAVVLNHLEEVLKTCKKSSSVLLVLLTTRYDLPTDNPIHRTVNRVNKHMADLCRRHNNVELVDIRTIGRQHYTRHGLHLRTRGKRLLAGLIRRGLANFQVDHSGVLQYQATRYQHVTYAEALSKKTSAESYVSLELESNCSSLLVNDFLGKHIPATRLN